MCIHFTAFTHVHTHMGVRREQRMKKIDKNSGETYLILKLYHVDNGVNELAKLLLIRITIA